MRTSTRTPFIAGRDPDELLPIVFGVGCAWVEARRAVPPHMGDISLRTADLPLPLSPSAHTSEARRCAGFRDFTLTVSGSQRHVERRGGYPTTRPRVELTASLQRAEPPLAAVPLPVCVRLVGGCLSGLSVARPSTTTDDMTASGRVLSVDVT